MTSDDSRISKLPQWAQGIITEQQNQINRLQSLTRTQVEQPWLYTTGTDMAWSPFAGDTDRLALYGPDPRQDPGSYGIRIHKGRDDRTLDVTAMNGELAIQPVSGNHIRIVILPDQDDQ